MRFAVVILLVILGACNREPLEIPEPDLTKPEPQIKVDWKKHLYSKEEPVDESKYPPCDVLPMMLNPGHPDNYGSRYNEDTIYSGLKFQSGTDPLYAVYVRYVPDERDSRGFFNLIGQVVLLDLRNGDTTTLGSTNGWPSIGGKYVVFPTWDRFVLYNLFEKEKEVIDGAIEGAQISPTGKKVWFRSNRDFGGLQKWHSYVFDVQHWTPLLEVHNDEMYHAAWLSDTDFAFVRILDLSLYRFEFGSMKTGVLKGPYESHFKIFTGISSDLKYAYGTKTYALNLETGSTFYFGEEYDEVVCETKDYGQIFTLPDGQLLAERYYRPIDTMHQIVYFQHELRLFDADGTNERMVTLLLK